MPTYRVTAHLLVDTPHNDEDALRQMLAIHLTDKTLVDVQLDPQEIEPIEVEELS